MTMMTRRHLLATGTSLAALLPFANACAPAAVMSAGAGSDNLDGVAMAQKIASGETTSIQLTEAAIARAEAVNPQINALATKTYDLARTRAAAAPAGEFGGVPTAIKDLDNWKGAPTMYGSRAFRGNLAETDSVLPGRWREAGVVVIGKSSTPEMGSLKVARWVIRRRSGAYVCARRPLCPCKRWRRLDPYPCRLLWAFRTEAFTRGACLSP